MKSRLPKDAFRAVKLSQEEQNALVQEAETVVRETIAANEAFLDIDATFQDPQWKTVREKEGLRVYCQRRKNRRTSKATSDQLKQDPFLSVTRRASKSSSRYRGFEESSTGIESSMSTYSAFAENSIMEKMRPTNVPLMALHGTMDGTLDDCMFGCLASTDDAWRLRSSHIQGHIDDAKILATIKGPTRQEPFRYLGVKWFTQENPAMLSGIMQQRDYLIMESSGLTRDSEGAKVAYFLMHSVKLRDVPELSDMGFVRATMSFCCIFRQTRPGQVSLHSLGFFDTRGGMPGRMAIAGAADGIIGLATVVDYAYTKKLMWLMSRKGKQSGQADSVACYCQACGKNLTKFSLSGSNGSCQICHLVVCAKCSVVKKMTVDISDTGAAQRCSLRFCLCCLVSAKQRSSSEMVFSGTGTPSRSQFPAPSQARLISLPQTSLDEWTDDPHSEYQPARTRVHQRINFARSKYPERATVSECSEFQAKANQSLPVPGGKPLVSRVEAPEEIQSLHSFRPRANNKAVHEFLDDYEFQTGEYCR
ncbi:hypothetical protein PRIC1_004482 [Phytophthora ramorum]